MIKRITFVRHDLNVMFSLLFWAYLLFIIITNDGMQIDWLKTCRLHVYYKRRMCKEKTIKRAGKICRGIFIINSYRLKRGGKRIGCDIHTALLRTHAHFCFYFKGGYIYIYIFPSFCFFQAGCRSLKNGRDTRKALLTLDCVDFLIPYAQAAL